MNTTSKSIFDKWGIALLFYTCCLLVASWMMLIEAHNSLIAGPYIIGTLAFLAGMVRQAFLKRWRNIILGLFASFSITVFTVTVVFVIGMVVVRLGDRKFPASKEFYSDSFKRYTGVAYPNDAVFLAKNDTVVGRGSENEYKALAYTKLSKQGFRQLLTDVKSNNKFEKATITRDADDKFTNPEVLAFRPRQTYRYDNAGRARIMLSFDDEQDVVLLRIQTY